MISLAELPSYRGFADRKVESTLYGVLQRRFVRESKQCDVVVGNLLAELLPDCEGILVLDVGCGNGQLIAHLQSRFTRFRNGDRIGWEFRGIDLRPEAIREATRYLENVPLTHADLFDYPLAERVDVIVCQSATYSFTDEQFSSALARFRSWLQPGGLVILFDMFTPWEQHLTVVERSLHHPDGHLLTVRPYSQLRELTSAAGLEVLEIRPFTYQGGQCWLDPNDLRSHDYEGLTMRGCFNQPQAHVVLVAV